MEEGAQKREIQNKKKARRLLGKSLLFVLEKKLAASAKQARGADGSAEEEEMKQQLRMKIMKDLTKKIRSNGRMDAQNRWWVTELLAADCERAWIHPGWEITMQKWYEWLEEMKKKDEKEKMEGMYQHKVVPECGRKCWTLAQDL